MLKPSFKNAMPRGSKKPSGGAKNRQVVVQRRGVTRSSELDRIKLLPRRSTEIYNHDFAYALSQEIRKDGSDFTLKPKQAAILVEAVEARGLFCMLGVGAGKTVASPLFGKVLGLSPVVMLVPPSIKTELLTRVIPWLLREIDFVPPIVVSYSDLQVKKNSDLLERLQPKAIVADEAHMLKNKGAARTKRVSRYFDAHPETIFITLSGTIMSRSLMDFHHLMLLTHPGWKCPMPRGWNEVKDWALALDAHVPEDQRMNPGAILELCRPGESAREGFSRRLVDTEGVIAGSAEDVKAKLVITTYKPAVPEGLLASIKYLRKYWEMPDGSVVTDAKDFHRKARELAQGFYYVWDWPNGEVDNEWLTARAAWALAVRETTKLNREGLDSEALVREAAEREYKGTAATSKYVRLPKARRAQLVQTWLEWNAVSDRPEPPNKAIWLDDFIVREAMAWGEEAKNGIIWYHSKAVGEKAMELGANVFKSGKKFNDQLVLLSERKGDHVIFASGAHGTGKNLQHKWSKNLVICPWPGGKIWEQTIGRTHRPFQPKDLVTVDVYVHTEELEAALEKAKIDALAIQETTKTDQKLMQATWIENYVREGK